MAELLDNIIGQLKDHNKKQLTVADNTLTSINEQQERLAEKLEGMISILNAGGSLNSAQLRVLEENLEVSDTSAEGIKVFLDDINVVFDQQKLELEDIKVILEGGGVLAQAQLEALESISSDTITKEDKLETRNEQEKLRDLLVNIGESINVVAENAKNAESAVADKGGMLATVAALGLAVFSPETLVKGFESFTSFLMDTSTFFSKWFSSDGASWDDTMEYLGDNWEWLLGTLGAIAIKFGAISKIIGLIASTVTGFGGVMGTLGAIMSGLSTAVGILLSPAAAIVGLVVAIGKSIWDAFDVFGDMRDAGASMSEALSGAYTEFMSTFLGLPLDLLKSVVSWFADILGFENFSNFLDSFSFEDSISAIIEETITAVSDFFKSIFDFIPSFDDIKNGLYNMLPGWAQGIVGAPEASGSSATQPMTSEQLLDSTVEAGMYTPQIFGTSDIDRESISSRASIEQINAILEDDDISTSDTKFLKELVEQKKVALEISKQNSKVASDSQTLINQRAQSGESLKTSSESSKVGQTSDTSHSNTSSVATAFDSQVDSEKLSPLFKAERRAPRAKLSTSDISRISSASTENTTNGVSNAATTNFGPEHAAILNSAASSIEAGVTEDSTASTTNISNTYVANTTSNSVAGDSTENASSFEGVANTVNGGSANVSSVNQGGDSTLSNLTRSDSISNNAESTIDSVLSNNVAGDSSNLTNTISSSDSVLNNVNSVAGSADSSLSISDTSSDSVSNNAVATDGSSLSNTNTINTVDGALTRVANDGDSSNLTNTLSSSGSVLNNVVGGESSNLSNTISAIDSALYKVGSTNNNSNPTSVATTNNAAGNALYSTTDSASLTNDSVVNGSALYNTVDNTNTSISELYNTTDSVGTSSNSLYNTAGFDGGSVTPLPRGSIPGQIPSQSLETSTISLSNVNTRGSIERAVEPVSKVRTAVVNHSELESESKSIERQTQKETNAVLASIAKSSGSGGGNNVSNNSSNVNINNTVFPDNVVPTFTMRYSY